MNYQLAMMLPEKVFEMVKTGEWTQEQFVLWATTYGENRENDGWDMCQASEPSRYIEVDE